MTSSKYQKLNVYVKQVYFRRSYVHEPNQIEIARTTR